MTSFEFSYDTSAVTLRLLPAKRGLFARLMHRPPEDIVAASAQDRRIAFALADMNTLADQHGLEITVTGDQMTLPHRLVAAADAETAKALNLPPLTDMTLRTDVEGVLGSDGFRLRCEWIRAGQQRAPRRAGAILATTPPQRIPLWAMEVLDIAEGYTPNRDDAKQWEALARFRHAIDPGLADLTDTHAAHVAMTDFLAGLEVRLADSFSIAPHASGEDFEVVPFAKDRLTEQDATEAMAELAGTDLQQFQSKLRERGALNAFRLSPGRYMVVDRTAAPALEVIAEMQQAPRAERQAFMENPRARITQAVETRMRATGALDGLDPAAEEEAIESAAAPVFIETVEFQQYSDRVIGTEVYRGNPLGPEIGSGTTWLPELFTKSIAETLDRMGPSELQKLREDVADAVTQGRPTVPVEDEELPANTAVVEALDARIHAEPHATIEREDVKPLPVGPIVLSTIENFEDVGWHARITPRASDMPHSVPQAILTPLKQHQIESLNWQIDAWKSGLPGVLNADEPGLGKTLQTISFLVWLNEHMQRVQADRGPVLIVAPTSLLENWEQEVKRHVASPGLGNLIRLYGSATGARKRAEGRDTDRGEQVLDFDDLHRSINAGAGHLTWVLTTYTTLANYQHSLGRIPFAAAVFDEIQALKNPGTIAAKAARAIKARFSIGLTGTPIENRTLDLWAVMEPLAAGALGSMTDFRGRYGTADEANMAELHARVFKPHGATPAMAIRRIKEDVARDLPAKTRLLHPRLMPAGQALRYDEARKKVRDGQAGLQLLHHIRGVSLHPTPDAPPGPDFIDASARLSATMDILRRIKAAGERALVFIELRQMQYRFIELAKAEFGLLKIELINGETPIRRRLAIVNEFQRHLTDNGGFDLLVLGPKAAGTGLTLTAATHVIHLSRWWNPAVEEQCNDRIHRIGQTRPVTVHVPMAVHPGFREHSFDLLLQSLMQRKRRLASAALWPMGDDDSDVEALQKMLASDEAPTNGAPLEESVRNLFRRDKLPEPARQADGAYRYP